MRNLGRKLEVKEWMANKIAQEAKKNITMCEVFGILKETEKAVYALVNIGCGSRKTTWLPKSALVEATATNEYFGETYAFDTYEEAVEEFNNMWNLYR